MAIPENLSGQSIRSRKPYVFKVSTKSVPSADLRLECLKLAFSDCYAPHGAIFGFPRLRKT